MPADKNSKTGQEDSQNKEGIFCGMCGSPMSVWQCRYVCKNCGYTATCSEENIFYD